MRIRSILLLILLSSKLGFGQHNQISFLYGFGSYRMNDLKEFQEYNLSSINPQISAKLLENFPVNNFVQGTWKFPINDQYKIGFVLGYHTTGSQIHYADYTGQLSYRIVTKAYNFGINIERVLLRLGEFEIVANTTLSFYSTVIKTKDVLIIFNNIESKVDKYEAVSPTLEPCIFINYNFKPFIVGFHAGYLLDPGARLFRNYNDSSPVNFNDFGELRSNWTGFRIGVSVGFIF